MSKSEKETKEIASFIATQLKKGDIVTLEGDLGVGKTTFTKGFAKGLAITRNVTSPTFTMMKQYKGTLPLYHIDAYRLENEAEDIGFEELIGGDGIAIIEWAQFIEDFLPNKRLNIVITMIELNKRELAFQPIGKYYENIMVKIKEYIEHKMCER